VFWRSACNRINFSASSLWVDGDRLQCCFCLFCFVILHRIAHVLSPLQLQFVNHVSLRKIIDDLLLYFLFDVCICLQKGRNSKSQSHRLGTTFAYHDCVISAVKIGRKGAEVMHSTCAVSSALHLRIRQLNYWIPSTFFITKKLRFYFFLTRGSDHGVSLWYGYYDRSSGGWFSGRFLHASLSDLRYAYERVVRVCWVFVVRWMTSHILRMTVRQRARRIHKSWMAAIFATPLRRGHPQLTAVRGLLARSQMTADLNSWLCHIYRVLCTWARVAYGNFLTVQWCL